jgi:hypothetical protein
MGPPPSPDVQGWQAILGGGLASLRSVVDDKQLWKPRLIHIRGSEGLAHDG